MTIDTSLQHINQEKAERLTTFRLFRKRNMLCFVPLELPADNKFKLVGVQLSKPAVSAKGNRYWKKWVISNKLHSASDQEFVELIYS